MLPPRPTQRCRSLSKAQLADTSALVLDFEALSHKQPPANGAALDPFLAPPDLPYLPQWLLRLPCFAPRQVAAQASEGGARGSVRGRATLGESPGAAKAAKESPAAAKASPAAAKASPAAGKVRRSEGQPHAPPASGSGGGSGGGGGGSGSCRGRGGRGSSVGDGVGGGGSGDDGSGDGGSSGNVDSGWPVPISPRSTRLPPHMGVRVERPSWYNDPRSGAVDATTGTQQGSTCGLHAVNHVLALLPHRPVIARDSFELVGLNARSGDTAANLVQPGGSNYDVTVLTANLGLHDIGAFPMMAEDIQGAAGTTGSGRVAELFADHHDDGDNGTRYLVLGYLLRTPAAGGHWVTVLSAHWTPPPPAGADWERKACSAYMCDSLHDTMYALTAAEVRSLLLACAADTSSVDPQWRCFLLGLRDPDGDGGSVGSRGGGGGGGSAPSPKRQRSAAFRPHSSLLAPGARRGNPLPPRPSSSILPQPAANHGRGGRMGVRRDVPRSSVHLCLQRPSLCLKFDKCL